MATPASLVAEEHTAVLEYRRWRDTVTYPTYGFSRYIALGVAYERREMQPVALRCHLRDELIAYLFRWPREVTAGIALAELLECAHALERQLIGKARFGTRMSYEAALAIAREDNVYVPVNTLMQLIPQRRPH
jgi:hypothetical protein